METIRARCPGCQKLYVVESKDIKTARPEFQCRKCNHKFWFEFPVKNPGADAPTFLSDTTILPQAAPPQPPSKKLGDTKQCPKCKAENTVAATSCMFCGIVFEKFGKKKTVAEDVVPVSLKTEWDNLLTNYEKTELHERFVSGCLTQKQLPFASAQYRKMLESNSKDPIALKMRDKIIELATATYIPPKREIKEPPRINISIIIAIGGLTVGGLGLMIDAMRVIAPIGFVVFISASAFIGYKYFKSQNEY